MIIENQQFLPNEPTNMDKKPALERGNLMGIRLIRGASRISIGLQFWIIDNWWVKYIGPLIWIVPQWYGYDFSRVWGVSLGRECSPPLANFGPILKLLSYALCNDALLAPLGSFVVAPHACLRCSALLLTLVCCSSPIIMFSLLLISKFIGVPHAHQCVSHLQVCWCTFIYHVQGSRILCSL